MAVILPLYSDSYYDYSINLGNASFRFEFSLNSRQGIYHFNVYDENETVLYYGVPLLYREYSDLTFPDAPGDLMLLPLKSGIDFEEVSATDIPNKFSFVFFSDEV